MVIPRQNGDFKTFKIHENYGIKVLHTTQLEIKTLIDDKKIIFSDFMQAELGNCGLIAALAGLSQRSEFLIEIAPKIELTSDGIKLHFNMFFEGEPITVTIDDSLPFDENNCLIYASSLSGNKILSKSTELLRNDDFESFSNFYIKISKHSPSLKYDLNRLSVEDTSPKYEIALRIKQLFLASFFEKVFVKQACNNSYKKCITIQPLFAFRIFSNCMTCCYNWPNEETKQNLMDCIKLEVDNKSSVVLSISTALEYEPNEENANGHAYLVMDYNYQHKAVKLYDTTCNPEWCVSNNKLPISFIKDADANKGELWVSMDQLEKRHLTISCLHSKSMYKSVLQIKRNLKKSFFDKQCSTYLDVCKVNVRKTTQFMINFLSHTHKIRKCEILVSTADGEREKVQLDYELPKRRFTRPDDNLMRGDVKTEYCQRFNLKPNTYMFIMRIKPYQNDFEDHDVSFLMKVGSVSKCTMEEV